MIKSGGRRGGGGIAFSMENSPSTERHTVAPFFPIVCGGGLASSLDNERAAGNVHSFCGTGSIHFHVSIGDPVRFSNASALHLQLASGLVNIFSYLAILDGLCIMRLTLPAPEAFAPSPAIFSYLWRLSA